MEDSKSLAEEVEHLESLDDRRRLALDRRGGIVLLVWVSGIAAFFVMLAMGFW